MKKILMAVFMMASTLVAADTQVGVMGSVLFNVPEIDLPAGTSGIDEKSELGFGLGMRALVGLSDQFYLRTGAGFVQKKVSVKIGTLSDVDYSVSYLNIPATLHLKASPQVGIFAGTNLSAKLSDDCDASVGTCSFDAESLVLPVVLGFDFVMNDQFSFELSYEHGVMETAENIKISSAVASIVYNFEN